VFFSGTQIFHRVLLAYISKSSWADSDLLLRGRDFSREKAQRE
jgi:hypothetical protein